MDEGFKEKYTKLSKRYALTWALKKDEILSRTVEDIFDKYNVSPVDASLLNVCITVMAMKQTQAKIGQR